MTFGRGALDNAHVRVLSDRQISLRGDVIRCAIRISRANGSSRFAQTVAAPADMQFVDTLAPAPERVVVPTAIAALKPAAHRPILLGKPTLRPNREDS